MLSLGIEPMILALLAPCSTIWATGKLLLDAGPTPTQETPPLPEAREVWVPPPHGPVPRLHPQCGWDPDGPGEGSSHPGLAPASVSKGTSTIPRLRKFLPEVHSELPVEPTSTHYYESTSPPEVWDLLVNDALWYYHREAQNHSPEHSRSPFLAGGIIFPPLSGMLDPCLSSSNNWKLISFGTTWLHPKLKKKKKKKTLIFPFIFLSFPC